METTDHPYPIIQDLFSDENCHYYRSVDHVSQQPVIVKEITCATEIVFRQFIREGLRQAELRHPNIVRMLDMIPVKVGGNWKLFSVFEHIECRLGNEIERRRIAPEGPEGLSEEELRKFLRTIAEVLVFAKTKGLSHRNIDPDHIYIDGHGNYKVSDFVYAWRKENPRDEARTVIGNAMYMCPQMKGAFMNAQDRSEVAYDPEKADIYSLGITVVILQRLFIPPKNHPLDRLDNLERNIDYYLEAMGENLSRAFVDIVRNMLKLKEAERFTAANVLEALSEPPQRVVSVRSDALLSFNFSEGIWNQTAFHNPIPITETTSFAYVGENVFCCGGGASPCKHYVDKKAFTINTTTGNVIQEGDMRVGRTFHGLLFHPETNSALVFGGANLKSCEKYKFPTRNTDGAWTVIKDMQQVRCRFNPCLFAGLVYLVGGGHASFEVFEPKFDQYKDMKVQKNAPSLFWKQLRIDPGVGIVVQHNEVLVMLSRTSIYRWNPIRDQLESPSEHTGLVEWSNATPIVSGDAVFAVSVSGSNHTMIKIGLFSGRAVAMMQ